jgi:methyl-accepting chemotaxis protein
LGIFDLGSRRSVTGFGFAFFKKIFMECVMFKLSLKNHVKTILLLLACLAVNPSFSAPADSPYTAKVRESMRTMKNWTKILGPAKQEGESLFFGKTLINIDFVIVDGLKGKFGGTATFFVKKGDGFMRISTNVMKDGKRAIGTVLDPAGPAIAAIKQGKAFYGIVDILGSRYDTGYEPITNATGETIGVYYVGYKLE